MDLTLRLLGDSKQAEQALNSFGASVIAASTAIKELAKEAVTKFAEAERVQRQFRIAAGESTKALNEQIEAMKEKFAVDDDEIRHMDVLLLRYGAAPAAIEKTTEAVLNYSAATGKDATQAMEQLIRGVESGTGSLGRMGVHFKATGDFSKDLAAAVDALNKKFHGAGEEDAKSMSGRLRSVSMAVDDLFKTFGAMFDEVDRRFSILDKIARGLNAINRELQGEGLAAFLGLKSSNTLGSAEREVRANVLFDESDPRWQERLAKARTADSMGRDLVGFLKSKGAIPSEAGQVGASLPTQGSGEVKPGKGPKEKDDWGWGPFGDPESSFEGWEAEYKEMNAKKDALLFEQAMKDAQAARKHEADEAKEEEKRFDEKAKQLRAIADAEIDAEADKQRKLEHLKEKEAAADKRRFEHKMQIWKQAGAAIGAALVNAISDQLQRLAEGGDVDPAHVVGDVLATILGIAGVAVGAYIGGPAGAQLGGAIGGLAGSLASTGIKAGFGRKKQHEGGWLERYHEGGWMGLGPGEVPFIGLTGERVLSRDQVSRMGGPRAVDAAANGRSGSSVVINAIDSLSFLDQFGGDGRAGRGFFNAIRVGRGDLQPLFG